MSDFLYVELSLYSVCRLSRYVPIGNLYFLQLHNKYTSLNKNKQIGNAVIMSGVYRRDRNHLTSIFHAIFTLPAQVCDVIKYR